VHPPAPSQGRRKIILGNLKIPIDVIPTIRYILLVLPDEGPLSRGDPSWDRARAGRTGGPRNGRQAGGRGGAPGGAAPYVTGRARFTLPREVGTLFPPQGCPLVPWRLPPLHPLARSPRDFANLGRVAPRECEAVAV
jgi:hypothetical protein